ncbi:MAG TPA: acyl-CoA dehydrogenase family protein [Acidimicrobiales bacterium]|nr:acyl-CoA dehydrogenase family protein [Acidimicrobiales bacterium]
MDFRVDEGQRALADGVRSMVAGRLPLERIRAAEGSERTISADDWAALGETGVFALTLPEPAGVGLGLADVTVVFEELGRALVPGPLVGTFLAAARDLVPGAAEGRAMVGLAIARGGPPWMVEHLSSLDAAFFLPAAGTGGGRDLVRTIRNAPTAHRVREPLDPLTPLWALAELPAGDALDDPDQAIFSDGAVLTAALQVGHAAQTLELAVAYAKERHQFGKPIGSFQAVKHMCADMLVRAEVARAAVHAAACLADEPDVLAAEAAAAGSTPFAFLQRSAAGAKLLADEAAITNARTAIQVHGGMGYTWEVPLHLHLKRAHVLAMTFGTRDELASLVGDLLHAPAAART